MSSICLRCFGSAKGGRRRLCGWAQRALEVINEAEPARQPSRIVTEAGIDPYPRGYGDLKSEVTDFIAALRLSPEVPFKSRFK